MPYIMPRLIHSGVAGLFNDLSTLAISPRAKAVLFADSVSAKFFKVDNEHQRFRFLGEIWYESRLNRVRMAPGQIVILSQYSLTLFSGFKANYSYVIL